MKCTEEYLMFTEKYVLIKKIKKMFTNALNCSKKVKTVFKMKTGRPTMAMVNSVNAIILVNRTEDISEQLVTSLHNLFVWV